MFCAATLIFVLKQALNT